MVACGDAQAELASEAPEGGAGRVAAGGDDGEGIAVAGGGDHDLAAADEGGLFAGDGGVGGAEAVGVLLLDVGDDGDGLVVEDVGAVGATAEADLDGSGVAAFGGEVAHAGGEGDFNEGGAAVADAVEDIDVHLADEGVEAEDGIGECVGVDEGAVDIDALDERL